MKKITKILATCAFAALLLSSCNVENVGPVYSSTDSSTDEVSFLQSTMVSTELNSKTTSFNVPLVRSNTANATTVAISSTDTLGIIPSSVSFAAGEAQTDLVIDISSLAVGVTFKATLQLTDSLTFNANTCTSKATVTLAKAYTWLEIGEGEWYSDCLALEKDLNIRKVKCYQAEGFNRYRVETPYTKEAIVLSWGEEYFADNATPILEFEVDAETGLATRASNVWYTGVVYPGYGNIVLTYPSAYSPSAAAYDAYNKVIADGVIQFVSRGHIEASTAGFGWWSDIVKLPTSTLTVDLQTLLSS